jgi:hypothetical protein
MDKFMEDEIVKVYDPKTGEEIPTDQLAIRLTKKEQARYARTLNIVFSRNKWVGKADVNRLLIGMITDHKLLTEEEIEYFRGMPEPPTLLANVPETPQARKEAKIASPTAKRHKGKK